MNDELALTILGKVSFKLKEIAIAADATSKRKDLTVTDRTNAVVVGASMQLIADTIEEAVKESLN